MELHLSLRLSITMMNPMPAAFILQKRVVSVRDQVRHTGSGRLPRGMQPPWRSRIMCERPAWHKGVPGSGFPEKATTTPGSLNITEMVGVSNPLKVSASGWQSMIHPRAHMLMPERRCKCHLSTTCPSVGGGPQGGVLSSPKTGIQGAVNVPP